MRVHPLPQPTNQRPQSQIYREAALRWNDLDAAARLLEDPKSAVLAQRISQLLGEFPHYSHAKAEAKVKASDAWHDYVQRVVAARTAANRAQEPSGNGDALKIARKGVGTFLVDIEGRASHAGLEPEKGINALIELAHQVQAIAAIAKPEVGTTVTPTVATAGTTENVVPAQARITVDVRVNEVSEKGRVEAALAALTPNVPGAKITVSGSINRPPMHESAATELFAVAKRLADEMGIDNLQGIAVGGGSDGNFTAAIGVPTLDGFGACGGGAHADTEHVKVSKMAERAALLAAVTRELITR